MRNLHLLFFVLISCLTIACSKDADDTGDKDFTHSCKTVDSGLTPEELARVNAYAGTSKVYLEQGLFDTTVEAKRQSKAGPVIPSVATTSKADTLLVNDYQVLRLTPQTIQKADTVILYIHGGAYLFDMNSLHVMSVDEMCQRLGVVAYMPSYPLLPNVTYEVAHAMVRQLYTDLLAKGKKVLLMGDSAGGGFALALAQWAHQSGVAMPERMVLLSPWLDVTMANPDIAGYEAKDVTLANYGLVKCGQLWAGIDDLSQIRNNTQVCPLYGDLTGMPPTLLFVGTAEVMYPDVTSLYERLVAKHSTVHLVYGKDLFHVYPLYFRSANLPAATEAIADICNFVK